MLKIFVMVGKRANYSEKQVRTNEIITPIYYLLSSERNDNFHLLALIALYKTVFLENGEGQT